MGIEDSVFSNLARSIKNVDPKKEVRFYRHKSMQLILFQHKQRINPEFILGNLFMFRFAALTQRPMEVHFIEEDFSKLKNVI